MYADVKQRAIAPMTHHSTGEHTHFQCTETKDEHKGMKEKRISVFFALEIFFVQFRRHFVASSFSLSVYVHGEFSVFTSIHTHVRAFQSCRFGIHTQTHV